MMIPNECIGKHVQKLQPICLGISELDNSIASKKTLKLLLGELNEVVMIMDPRHVEHLLPYLLPPFQIYMKKYNIKKSESYVLFFQVLNEVLCRGVCHHHGTLWNMLDCLSTSISSKGKCPGSRAVNEECAEEILLSAIRCIESLMEKLPLSTAKEFFVGQNLPLIAFIVNLLLDIASHESLRALRLQALSALSKFSFAKRKVDDDLKAILAQLFATVLPGILQNMTSISLQNLRQGHSITEASIELWQDVVLLVASDKSLKLMDPIKKEDFPELPVVHRDKSWIGLTGFNLQHLVKKMMQLMSHSHWKVRKVLTLWAQALLKQMTIITKDYSGLLLSVIAGLMSDDSEQVRSTSKKASLSFPIPVRFTEDDATLKMRINSSAPKRSDTVLSMQKVSKKCDNESSDSLIQDKNMNLLIQELENSFVSLPSRIRYSVDGDAVLALQTFCGYLQLLDSNLKQVFNLPGLTKQCFHALLNCITLDLSSISFVLEIPTVAGSTPFSDVSSIHCSYPKKQFKFLFDLPSIQQVNTICQLLGEKGDLMLQVDLILEMFHGSAFYRKEVTYIIVQLLLGSVRNDEHEEAAAAAKSVLSSFLGTPWLHIADNSLPQSALVNICNSTSLMEQKSDVALVCLILECIGGASLVLGEAFKLEIMTSLYAVLELMAHGNARIEQSAYCCLIQFTKATQCRCIADLIHCNADYLLDSVVLGMRKLQLHLSAPRVLQVVIKYSHPTIVPLVRLIIEKVLESLDNFHSELCSMLLDVLVTLSRQLLVWFPVSDRKLEHSSHDLNIKEITENFLIHETEDDEKEFQDIAEYFLNYHQLKTQSEGEFDCKTRNNTNGQDDQETDPNPPPEEDELKPNIPIHLEIAEQVYSRCIHLLNVPDAMDQLATLHIIQSLTMLLSTQKNQLLPLVHQLWPALTFQLLHGQHNVIIEVLKTLDILSEYCEDFLRNRISKEVVGKIILELERSAKVSLGQGACYRFCTQHRLQEASLQLLGTVCERCQLKWQDLVNIAGSCSLYLSVRQPGTLQKAARQLINRLALHDSNVAWLVLMKLDPWDVGSPPDKEFLSFPFVQQNSSEYTKNVEILRKELFEIKR